MVLNSLVNKAKSLLPFDPEWIHVNYVIFNTHVGAGVRNGGLAWLMKQWAPDIILCQEVKNCSLDRFKDEWHVVWYGTNAILARKSAFDLREHAGPDIQFGSPYLRNRVSAVLTHREARRVFFVQDVHLDPLYGEPDISKIRDMKRLNSHFAQARAYVEWQRERLTDRGAINVDGGDYNEFVDPSHLSGTPWFHRSVAARYQQIGMQRASSMVEASANSGPIRIDDLFFRSRWFLKVLRRRSVDLREEFPGLDHNTVFVQTEVRPRPQWTPLGKRLLNHGKHA